MTRTPASVVLATILVVAGCGDDGTGTSDSISFTATIAGASESGVIEVTAASPITGTLTITGGATISLTGKLRMLPPPPFESSGGAPGAGAA